MENSPKFMLNMKSSNVDVFLEYCAEYVERRKEIIKEMSTAVENFVESHGYWVEFQDKLETLQQLGYSLRSLQLPGYETGCEECIEAYYMIYRDALESLIQDNSVWELNKPDGTLYYSEDKDILQRMQDKDDRLDYYYPFDLLDEVGF